MLTVPVGWETAYQAMWPWFQLLSDPYPRTAWLEVVESALASVHPQASRADLNLTARSIAPFPLAAGSNVP